MKALIAATAAFLVSSVALAQDPAGTVRIAVNDSILKYVLPAQTDPGVFSCIASGNVAAAQQFVRKYGSQDAIWADQIEIQSLRGGTLQFRARLSADTGGRWVHQFYQMTGVATHTCSVGAVLVGESHD